MSILAGHRPEVLPPAEILFDGYRENQPRIVCYKAKWEESSFEYTHTPGGLTLRMTIRRSWMRCARWPLRAGGFLTCTDMPGGFPGGR
ncbi:MAG: hypothetical protein R2860_14080 [Desulfobacterales bacterium]